MKTLTMAADTFRVAPHGLDTPGEKLEVLPIVDGLQRAIWSSEAQIQSLWRQKSTPPDLSPSNPRVAGSRRLLRPFTVMYLLLSQFPRQQLQAGKTFSFIRTLKRTRVRVSSRHYVMCGAASTIVRIFSVPLTGCFDIMSARRYMTIYAPPLTAWVSIRMNSTLLRGI